MEIITKKIRQFILFQLFLLPVMIWAQTKSPCDTNRVFPELNQHYFIPMSAFPSPFMTTFFKTGIGGGLSLTTVPITYNGRTFATLEGEDAYIIADVHFQLRAKDWLSIWFRYQANARIGSSKPTFLAHGVTSITAFEFGWMFSLLNSKKSQLSSTIYIENSTIASIHLLNYIKDIIDNPSSDNAALSKVRNPLSVGLGLRYAHAFADIVGIQAYLDADYGEAILKRNETLWKFDMGFLGSFDFTRRYHVPLGITLGYMAQQFTLFSGVKEDNTTSTIVKIAYTGHKDYNIGFEISYNNTVTPLLENTATLQYLTTSFVMVYYF
jgi:hypothetical protein